MEQFKDLLFLVADGESEQGNGHVWIIDEMNSQKGNITFSCRRRDVAIERSPGNFLQKTTFGQQVFKGKELLDKKCVFQFRQENIIEVGSSIPRTFVAFSDLYDGLPANFKNNPKWNLAANIAYRFSDRMREELRSLDAAQRNETEMKAVMNRGTAAFRDEVMTEIERIGNSIVKDELKNTPGQMPMVQNPMKG